MTYKELHDQAMLDLRIERDKLDLMLQDVPNLSCKYSDLLRRERLDLKRKKQILDSLKKKKWRKYTGKYAEPGDEHDELVLSKDSDLYINADEEYQRMELEVEAQKEKVVYIEQVIRQINTRTFLIKDIIEWYKFTSGNN